MNVTLASHLAAVEVSSTNGYFVLKWMTGKKNLIRLDQERRRISDATRIREILLSRWCMISVFFGQILSFANISPIHFWRKHLPN